MIAQKPSINQNADFTSDSPILKVLLKGESISQSAFSRFFSKPFDWLQFAVGRIQRLQEHPESRLSEGDVIALDDTKVAHPFGKKLPFLCWLFDSSTRNHIWCMNLTVLKNGLEYPLFWRFWRKNESQDDKQTKLELARKMLLDLRSTCRERLWVAMDRWFICKNFFNWVTKAKKNTVLYCKYSDPVSRKEQYKKVNPKKPYCAMQDGNAIKKALKKPSPTAKWSGTYSTPVIEFAVMSNKSKYILTQLAIGFQSSSKNFGSTSILVAVELVLFTYNCITHESD
ncbi:hypothetical protein P378_14615 [Desulforamulus profundi]|uniref:Uncharacterized protein n=1 Tax=Desulforamulus profundi TaxID=1383067 RepID=A0A2C6MDR2_9FIRM|nr:hypothetical protein P378_14615 [Desulforamulus profundi]